MPEFTIACTSKKTGKDYQIRITAPNRPDAERLALEEGHTIHADPPGKPDHPSPDLLTNLLAEVTQLRAALTSHPLHLRPRRTIAWAIVLSYPLFALCLLLLTLLIAWITGLANN